MPAWRWRTFATPQIGGDLWTELHRPGADRLKTHVDAAMRKHLLNVTQTEREAKVQPDCVLNDGRWKAVTFIGKFASLGSPEGQ